MNKLTLLYALLMLTVSGGTQACPKLGDSRCATPMLLAEADRDEVMRYRETDEGYEQGPLTVRVTEFDGSPASPGMWYERPRKQLDDDTRSLRPSTSGAPFDRH